MTHLFRHIEYLLLHHDCVIVPGLGAFIASNMPARIDREARMIFPPSRCIMFNQAVTLDDGLLANSLARSLALSFDEARQLIAKEVASTIENLHSESTIRIGRLGTFTLGEEDRLIFTPASKPEEIAKSIGFSSVNLSHASQPVEVIDEKDDNQIIISSFRRRNRNLLKFTAVFSLFLIVALTFFFMPEQKNSQEHRASVVPVEALRSATSKQTDDLKEETPDLNDPVSTAPISTEAEVTIEEPTHYLIVATFHSKAEAEKYVELYSSDEYPLEVIGSRKVTRVSVASSTDKDELFKKLNSAPISQHFPNAWVWSASK